MAATGAYVHLTNDTTAQTNIPGAQTGSQLVRVVINQKVATGPTLMTLKDGTNVIAIIDLAGGSGFIFEYGVIAVGALSRTFSTTTTAFDLTLVFA